MVSRGVTVSVCAYITGKDLYHSETPSRALQGLTVTGFCLPDMDPGRFGLHQGWDNNSVIVVSSLIITYMG